MIIANINDLLLLLLNSEQLSVAPIVATRGRKYNKRQVKTIRYNIVNTIWNKNANRLWFILYSLLLHNINMKKAINVVYKNIFFGFTNGAAKIAR